MRLLSMSEIAANVTRTFFGRTRNGTTVNLLTLTNSSGAMARVTTYGAALTELHVPDKSGSLGNIVLGFDDIRDYDRKENPHFGGTIGRYANRIGGGRFVLDGAQYQLEKNDRQANCLHGGAHGFDRCVWEASEIGGSTAAVQFSRVSEDLESGFPGRLDVQVVYTWSCDQGSNDLKIDYAATCTKPTPVNLTNHSYFNLSGPGSGDILNHELEIAADWYTAVDANLIPTGELRAVAHTPLDFRLPHQLGERIGQLEHGYDHNYVLNSQPGKLAFAARLRDAKTGRSVEVHTTEPGLQLYTSYWLDGTLLGKGGIYERFGAVCLETQHFPDSPNKPQFPNTILRPGEEFRSTTIYRFFA